MENKIEQFIERALKIKDNLDTEEATKTALIMPFFSMLGYDVFNPTEFIPEYTADVGIKKGEKVDYAIKLHDELIMVIEAKIIGSDLNKVDSQLTRYFNVSETRIAVMTDGMIYKFYSDLDKNNIMDKTSFFEFDLSNISKQQINDIDRFTKSNFNIDEVLNLASDLKTMSILVKKLSEEFRNPSDELVKLLLVDVYDGIKTKPVLDQHKPIIKKAFNTLINETITSKINNVIFEENIDEPEINKIVTTEDELQFLSIIKSILCEFVDINRITFRDTESYFGILLDNNRLKWICRVKFVKDGINIYTNDNNTIKIQTLNDVYRHKDAIVKCLSQILES